MNKSRREYINSLASTIRQRCLQDFPVTINNLKEIVQTLGGFLNIKKMDEEEYCEALITTDICDENYEFEIAVDESKPINRQIFSIAHELGHIKHKDYIVMTVLSALPLIAYLIAEATLYAGAFSGGGRRDSKDNSGAALIVIGVIAFAIYILTFLIVMRLSRLREHYADAYSAYVTGAPRELESALANPPAAWARDCAVAGATMPRPEITG